MPEITLEQLLENQNDFINTRTAEINQLKTDVASALSEIDTLANREYSYSHTPVVVNSLEADYNTIISVNTEFANLSAVGIRAELKHGDTILKQGNRLFINTAKAENDYSFNGTNSQSGTEIVNIWYFENNSSLTLADCKCNVVEIRILNKNTPPSVDGSYYKYTQTIHAQGFKITDKPCGTKELYTDVLSIDHGTPVSTPDNVIYIESNVKSLDYYPSKTTEMPLRGRKSLKKIYLPELVSIPMTSGNLGHSMFGYFGSDGKCETEIIFPNLESIGDQRHQSCCNFTNISVITLPLSVKTIGAYCCDKNDTINHYCKDATLISNSWCFSAPTNFNMCEDWGASINISVASMNWNLENYIDLFENKLRNMESETRNITIPSSVLAELDEAVITAITAKGWTLGGA